MDTSLQSGLSQHTSAEKKYIWLLFLIASALFGSIPARAGEADATTKVKTSQSKRSTTVKHQPVRSTSEETTVQRDRRLSRECKGRPNAGACLGYAQR
jgi:hypothetical protein